MADATSVALGRMEALGIVIEEEIFLKFNIYTCFIL